MYYIKKQIEISASHKLALSYESKCENMHGHNWHITIYCKSKVLNLDGMVIDFTHIKQKVHSYLDHSCLNEKLSFNPTAENIAKWITDIVPFCYKCTVQESDGNFATYEKE